jgi:hypothetical protein
MIVDHPAIGLNLPDRSNRRVIICPETRSRMQLRIKRPMPSLKTMVVLNRLPCRFLALLAGPALIILASCSSDDGLGKRYPVSGTVTYNGNPLEKGEISFVSEDLMNNIGASGAIKNGSYTLSTGGNDDGAQAGKYKVTITSKEDFYAKAKADFEKESGRPDPGFIPQQFLRKAEADSKSLIPAGYGDPRTTNLTAEVKAQSNNPIDFKLSDADAPPPPTQAPTSKGRGRR